MPKLPTNFSGKDVVKILAKLGYEIDHQTGSHMILRQKEYLYRRLTIPNHKTLAKGTSRAIIKQSGLTREEFLNLV